MKNTNPARRRFLAGATGSALAGLLPTACSAPPSREPRLLGCSPSQSVGDASTPLTIDVHAHVFNGSDLQVERFLTQVVAKSQGSELHGIVEALGSILQFVAWHGAPKAVDESEVLRGMTAIFPVCGPAAADAPLQAARQAGYELGRNAIREARDKAVQQTGSAPQALSRSNSLADRRLALANDAIDDLLPPRFEEWQERRENARVRAPAALGALPLKSDETFAGYLDFVIHHFNYRHVNVLDYFETYSLRPTRKIDLLVPSLVDFDFWLARGSGTPSTLREQVGVMERIAVLSKGRVQAFVAFCPFREVATGQSMRLVKDAIENHGFIGVKLYPPMGFAAYGNCGLDLWRNKPAFPDPARDPKFGCMLDTAMRSLFEWCVRNDVPVMAHTNHSNGSYPEFEDLAGAAFWERALDTFKGLRVSFGHFGNTDSADDAGRKTRDFIHLMTQGAGSNGEHAFADSGFFADALTQEELLQQTLVALYRDDATKLVSQRFMYGTDWEMLLTQRNVGQYLERFIRIAKQLDAATTARPRGRAAGDAFMGWNAVEFLGLSRGRGNRRRLEAFYSKHNVPSPDWMNKIDRG